MKSSIDKFPGKRSKIYPSIQKETSTGGTATFVDSRSSTVYQRQLQKAMDAHVAAKAYPLQRKAATGSSRFQQVAADMGRKYGVDTSRLKATHQSPFPTKLNAEATIQGNNIHFAPGKDTDYNIRHEVAHAIDNKLNGTPKGDRLVNGQKIDTTREKVVDRMAMQSITQRKVIGIGRMTGAKALPSAQDERHLRSLAGGIYTDGVIQRAQVTQRVESYEILFTAVRTFIERVGNSMTFHSVMESLDNLFNALSVYAGKKVFSVKIGLQISKIFVAAAAIKEAYSEGNGRKIWKNLVKICAALFIIYIEIYWKTGKPEAILIATLLKDLIPKITNGMLAGMGWA